MNRLIIVYNPRSSRYAEVKRDVLSRTRELKGYMIGKYEVAPTNLNDNIDKLSKIIRDDDLILSAGGDATGIIASNAIIKSKKSATLAAIPYGNFNDLARTLRTKQLEDIIDNKQINSLYPLSIIINGKHWRYATCYVTIGMTAKAVDIYNSPKMRKKLKKSFGRKISSYTELMKWYFKHRRECILPEFSLNGIRQHKKTSDYAAVNGRSMARVMKGRDDYHDPKFFRSETDRLTNFFRLFKLMSKSILSRIPGSPTTGDTLEFTEPSTITLQAEGESETFKNVKKIEIKKGDVCLKVIEN